MINKKIYNVIGVMSGTSMDGLDCSLIKSDGINYCKVVYEHSFKYSTNYQKKLKKLVNIFPSIKNNKKNYLIEYEEFITKEITRIIIKFIDKSKYNYRKIDLIGFSGQTVYHNPKKKISIQLGSGQKLFEKIKIPIISNFRDKDILYGGQGAPIGCFYHKYLIKKINRNSAIINIGGVSNITLFTKNKLVGYDLGPGNALIDDLTYYFYKKKFDNKGFYAQNGNIIPKIMHKFKKNNFFKKKYPKSLDRNHFVKIFNDLKLFKPNDSIHTASLMTAYGILKGLKSIDKKIHLIIFTGGGRKNNFIINEINKSLNIKKIELINIDKFGYNGDMIEAQMFGYLAIRSLKKLPISVPSMTGVKKTVSGGIIYR